MAFGHLLMIINGFLFSNTALVCKAENTLFVKTGESVQLDIQIDKTEFNSLNWVNGKSENVVRFTSKTGETKTHSSYMDRVVFSQTSFSLTLKNMQKTDSGVYKAQIFGSINKNVAEYRVSVIDAVEAPVLTVVSNWSSSDSCTVHFTCTGHDDILNSTYNNGSCSQEKGPLLKEYTLDLRCTNDSIVCNYSNPVSWKNEMIEIKQLCTDHKKGNSREENGYFPLHWLIVIAVSVTVLLLVATVALYFSYKKHKKGDQQDDNTIYAEVEPQNEAERPHTSGTFCTIYEIAGENKQPCCAIKTKQTITSPESINVQIQEGTQREYIHPSTTYYKVGQHKKPSVPTERDQTIYAVVNKYPH
ncbi:SLAM family member 5-like [Xyrauchen texanus]|uniref:SLAM family member 5-like n=1 Tax=Xyrauchen texanus TaxID=154827 RepID=UPI002241E910|nr:SLAM family member 5-like [Xyrauchen texanus]